MSDQSFQNLPKCRAQIEPMSRRRLGRRDTSTPVRALPRCSHPMPSGGRRSALPIVRSVSCRRCCSILPGVADHRPPCPVSTLAVRRATRAVAIPPIRRIEEIVAVMRQAGAAPHGLRLPVLVQATAESGAPCWPVRPRLARLAERRRRPSAVATLGRRDARWRLATLPLSADVEVLAWAYGALFAGCTGRPV